MLDDNAYAFHDNLNDDLTLDTLKTETEHNLDSYILRRTWDWTQFVGLSGETYRRAN